MIKKTFKELRDLDIMVAEAYHKNEDLEKTKFGYAYKRFREKNYDPKTKEYNEELLSIRIDNALEDEKTKEIFMDPTPNTRGFKYSKDGLKKVVKAEKELLEKWDKKEWEIEPHISPMKPEDFSEEEIEMLTGLVL